ncbi:hypothetical protein LTR94_037815, partial [Friedmanniomyces endolithicus]
HLVERLRRPEHGDQYRRRFGGGGQQGQVVLAVGPVGGVSGDAAPEAARRHAEPVRREPAVFEPGLFLPVRVRSELYRSARAAVLCQ